LAAFLIVDVTEVSKEPIYAEYRHRAPTTLAAHVGTYLVRGGQVETSKAIGDLSAWLSCALSLPSARNWWHDPIYSELKAIRQRSTTTKMILLEGLPDA
jgi:uncharacterized protein (DUF1330 family)